jgi:pimeloyl-ACP methyl ester carboxylesterase
MGDRPNDRGGRPQDARADGHGVLDDIDDGSMAVRGVVEQARTASRFVAVHGYRRAYRMMGSGPPLLLVHGIGDNSSSWRPLMPALAERFTVIAPDLLGHGNSAKPRADYSVGGFANGMRDLLTVLDIDRVTIVGHSLGGGVAAQFAYQYPERCERLVLVSTGGVGRNVNAMLRLSTMPGAELFMPFARLPLARAYSTLALELLRRSGHDLGVDADELHRVLAELPDVEARMAFSRTLRAAVDWRGQIITMLDRFYLNDLPVQLVWGSRDAIIPVGHAHKAHSAMPGSRLEIFDGAGHFPHLHDPDRFVQVLTSFIDETEPARFDADHWQERLGRGRPLRRLRPAMPLPVDLPTSATG